MKIVKKIDIDYENKNINEENGWHIWDNWGYIKTVMKYINFVFMFTTFLLTFIFKNQIKENLNVIESMFFNEPSRIVSVIFVLLFVLTFLIIYLFLIVPIHELLHLFGSTYNILSDDCYIILGKGVVSAFFDRAETKNRRLFVLVLPVIVITAVLLPLIIINPYGLRICFLLFLYTNLYGSYSDIMMFFYIMKKVPKGSIMYGNRYKNS